VRSRVSFRARGGALVAIAMLAIGCAAPPAGGGTAGTGPTAGSTVGSTAAPATVAPASPAPATAAAATAMVDLTFSGTFNFTAKGTKGRCIVVQTSGGGTAFGFEATEADYPGLGQSFSMAEFGVVDIKWVIDADHNYGNSSSSVIQVSPDHHAVTVDEDLAEFAAMGGPKPGPEHVKGTVSCP
jgi:hypothetical protein